MSESQGSVAISSPIPMPIDGANPNAVKVDGSGVTQPVSGSVSVSNFPAPPVTSVNAATQAKVSVGPDSISTLVPARDGRLKVIIYSEGGPCYVNAGGGASVNQYTWLMQAGDYVEVTGYTGAITARGFNPGTFNVSVTDF